MNPYREPGESEHERGSEEDPVASGLLVALLAGIWVASVVRVVLAVIHHETFLTDATVATLVVVFLPIAVKRHVVARRRARRSERDRAMNARRPPLLGAIARLRVPRRSS